MISILSEKPLVSLERGNRRQLPFPLRIMVRVNVYSWSVLSITSIPPSWKLWRCQLPSWKQIGWMNVVIDATNLMSLFSSLAQESSPWQGKNKVRDIDHALCGRDSRSMERLKPSFWRILSVYHFELLIILSPYGALVDPVARTSSVAQWDVLLQRLYCSARHSLCSIFWWH